MKISILKNKISFVSVILALILGLGTTRLNAQDDQLAAAADLDQCRNGTEAVQVVCTGGAWVNGNANATQAHWSEGEFVTYRVRFTELSIGPHTFTIGYDILANNTHALDYLGTFNATETTSDPCSGVVSCTLLSPTSTFAIPLDTATVTNMINPNTGLPVVQVPGQFTMWGGTITSVAYEAYAGGVERHIIVTFDASVPDPVLAWGGHIAWVGDWGLGNSASNVAGSPYHMRVDNLDGSGGNQDHALQAAAVVPSGAVFVKKVAVPLNGSGSTAFAFPFTATANFGPTSFSLVDDNNGPGVDTQQSQTITSFGIGNTITVTEGSGPFGWTLSNVNCVESGTPNSTQNSIGPASIIVELGEVVTCTFTNTQLIPTAALVSVSGRVFTSEGVTITRARVIMTDQAGIVRTATTNNFGYYRFDDVEVGHAYLFAVRTKQYQFNPLMISLNDELTDLDFVAF